MSTVKKLEQKKGKPAGANAVATVEKGESLAKRLLSLITDDNFGDEAEAYKKIIEVRLKRNKSKSHSLLQAIGVHDENGELTKYYQS